MNRAGTLELTATAGEVGGRRAVQIRSRGRPLRPTPLFDTYERWLRFQRGDVRDLEDGDEYKPTAGAVTEERARREWDDLDWATHSRLAELELVRNESVARYRLQERDEWVAVSGTLRWKPTAVGDAERD